MKTPRATPEDFMMQAVAEALKGVGRSSPNPSVGAVVVKRGQVVGRGFTGKVGEPHGEIFALRDAGAKAKGADLYVTLEPCNHYGRTPPCTLAIIEAGIQRVFAGSKDPFPAVKGNLARLRRAGIEVISGVLREQTDRLHQPFFKRVLKKRPWVTLKAGITLDGKVAAASGDSRWVTGEASRLEVHRLRDRVDVIMVGAGTVRSDDPQLTTRLPKGEGRDPWRLVVDSHLSLKPTCRLFTQKSKAPTVVATLELETSKRARRLVDQGVRVWTVGEHEGRVDLDAVLAKLSEEGHLHLLVEGGPALHAAFLKQRLADEALLFIAPKIVGAEGLSWAGPLATAAMDQALALDRMEAVALGGDLMVRAFFP